MHQWKQLFFVPPEFETGQTPKWAKQTDVPGGRLVALVWGLGIPSAPYAMIVAHQTPPGPSKDDPAASGRYPTFEELQEAVDSVLPRDTFMAMNPVRSIAPEDRPEVLSWGGIGLSQVFPYYPGKSPIVRG